MNRKSILLFLILLLALILRVYRLDSVPSGFFSDEASIGYNAYKLLTTGKDEHGESWPFFFRSLGDYRTPIPIYSNILTIVIFGLTEFSVRLTTALYGTATVYVAYLIGKKLFTTPTGLLSAFTLAILPWHVHLSRWGVEYISFPFFFALAVCLFLYSLDSSRFFPLACIFFGLALYTYYPAWVIVPLFVIGAIVYWIFLFRMKRISVLLIGIVLFALVSLPLLFGIINGQALTRWNSIQKPLTSVSDAATKFVSSYRDHFAIGFLFKYGDIGYPGHFITRHSVRGMGELYWAQLPLLTFGMLLILTKWKRIYVLLILTLLLYPLGSVLTQEGPYATRSIIGVLPIIILSAHALTSMMKWSYSVDKKKILLVLCVFWICFEMMQFLVRYHKEYPLYASDYWGWQYGYRDSIQKVISHQSKYDELLITHRFNAGDILLKFYTVETPCTKCRVMDNPIVIDSSKKQLFVLRLDDLQEAKSIYPAMVFGKVDSIFLPNGQEEFMIGYFKPSFVFPQ